MERLRKTLPLREAYPFGEKHGLTAEMAKIMEMPVEWINSYTSTVRRGYIVEAFEKAGILSQFVAECWPFGATVEGQSKLRFYRNIKLRYLEFIAVAAPQILRDDADDDDIAIESQAEREFAQEADLRDFLAKNPEVIEKGLRIFEKDGIHGVEYAIDEGAGRIDLLAIDTKGVLVVIELKVSRGRNKTLGQLLYYMGWVDRHLGKTPARGIIIAKEITDDLRLATSRTTGISLCRYSLNVSVEKVS